MSRVDELFDRYRAAFQAGEDPDPRPFLDMVSGSDRRELAALIDGYLARAPRRPFDPDEREPLAQRIVQSLMEGLSEQETWRTLLPRARAGAELLRSDLVDRLADELGVPDKRDKVAGYYHRMEQGTLAAHGVSDRVLRVLSRIIGISFQRLRAAGQRLTPPSPGAPAAVFARSAPPAPALEHATERRASEPAEEPWDEVDELFCGG